jgi:hypothetical protein
MPVVAEKWYVSTPPAAPLFDAATVAEWLRVDPADAAQLADVIAAAVEYAEEAMATSLMPRTITATFYAGEPVRLPRGPVLEVLSVTGHGGAVLTDYDVTHVGRSIVLKIKQGFTHPLTVVYRAGYASASAVPADIRQAVKAHVGTLWEHRESVSGKKLEAVPHQLADFYRLKARTVGVK